MEDTNPTIDNVPPPTTPPSRPSGFMDVQRPRPTASAPTPATPPVRHGTPQSDSVDPPTIQTSPDQPVVTSPDQHLPADNHPAPEQPVAPDHMLPAHAKHTSKPVLAIVAAVLIAVGMIGIAVFAYMRTNQPAAPDHTPTEHEQMQSSTTQPATAEDVNRATEGVDRALGATDEATEFSENELSDQTLGL